VSDNRPALLNRGLLTLAGVLLLAAGLFTVGTSLGILHLLPSGQSLIAPGTQPAGWAPYPAAAAAILLGLGCVRWLAAQGQRRPKTTTWRLEAQPGNGATRLDAGTATGPLVADVQDYDGVRSASAWLSGDRDSPALHLVVRTEYDADLAAIREQIHSHALPRLCRALSLPGLPVTVQFQPTAATTRVR
jgi:hypothetical protein